MLTSYVYPKYMRISVDGGALCSPPQRRYGNFSFSADLLQALSKYDNDNIYYLYTYCTKPKSILLNRNIIHCRIRPKTMWMNFRVPIEEFLKKPDIFLAINQAIPLFTKAAVISFSHGASFIKKPEYYKYSKIRLGSQLNTMIKRSKFVIVSSVNVLEELAEIFPNYKNKIRVLSYGVPSDFNIDLPRSNSRFFLFVGMNHRVKNIQFLLNAFEKFRQNPKYSDFVLNLVGTFSNFKNLPHNVKLLGHVSRPVLAGLYSKASAYLTASHYESFNYPVLEALATGCPVIGMKSSVISEMKAYVNISETEDDFISRMEQAAEGKLIEPDSKIIKAKFSWSRYIEQLLKLYSEI